jgi:hypothetical protein
VLTERSDRVRYMITKMGMTLQIQPMEKAGMRISDYSKAFKFLTISRIIMAVKYEPKNHDQSKVVEMELVNGSYQMKYDIVDDINKEMKNSR